MNKSILKTSKISGESEQNYTAWLLYCEAGSLNKLHRMWERLHQGFSDSSSEIAIFKDRLGSPPTVRTLAEWSKKYRWVERQELKLSEELEIMKEKVQKIKREKTYKIAELFERMLVLLIKKIKTGYDPTIQELKQIWEMLRTELGETISKHEIVGINESEQKPPTPEEMELGKKIDQAIITFYEERGRKGSENKIAHLIEKSDKKALQ